MKKILIILFILIGLFIEVNSKESKDSDEPDDMTILGNIELSYPLLGKHEKYKGQIVFPEIKYLRSEKGGGKDRTLLGNEDPLEDIVYRASRPINSVIYEMFYEALNYSGFDVVTQRDNRHPVFVVEIINFFAYGYMFYGVVTKFRIKLYTPDMSKILYTKDIIANGIIFGNSPFSFEIAYNKMLIIQMMNILTNINGSIFHESYKGREYKTKNYLLELDKKKLKEIPSDIQHPEDIRELSLYNNDIKNLNGLEKFTDLEVLDLTKNELKKIDNINNPNLKSLSFNRCEIEKIENLDKLKKLEILDLCANEEISKIEGLDNLENLKWLDLSYNKIKKIENIDNLTNLVGLDLSSTKIKKIENIDNLKNLKWLSLKQCTNLKKIENLNKLTNLTYLDISYNDYNLKLSKIENLDKLVNLQYLNLKRNSLYKIENLDDLVSLRKLDLSYCGLTKIEGLDNLINLEELIICSYSNTISNIKKIQGLDNLINLRVLDLRGNDISRIENIEKLRNLKTLYISWNNVISISYESYVFIKEKINPGLFIKNKFYNFDNTIKHYHIKIDKPKK